MMQICKVVIGFVAVGLELFYCGCKEFPNFPGTTQKNTKITVAISDNVQLEAMMTGTFTVPDTGVGIPFVSAPEPDYSQVTDCGFDLSDGISNTEYPVVFVHPSGNGILSSIVSVGMRLKVLKDNVKYSVKAYCSINGNRFYSEPKDFVATKEPAKWLRLSNSPMYLPTFGTKLNINGDFLYCESWNYFWKYSPNNNSWTNIGKYRMASAMSIQLEIFL